MKLLAVLVLSACAFGQTGNACSTNTAAATGTVQSFGLCQPGVIDGKNKGGWIALNRAADLSNNETACYDPQAVSINQGLLTIQTSARARTCHYYSGTTPTLTGTFSSGFVQWNTFSITGGDILVRAKGPSNVSSGGWPAIWLLGANCEFSSKVTADNVAFNGKTCAWHGTGSEEIDIWEELNGTNTTTSTCNFFFQTTVRNSSSYTYTDSSANWHVYELRWVAGTSLQWWVDGVQITACNSSVADIPNSPMFLQINNAMGPGATSTGLGSSLQVDWVKVCQPSPCNGSGNNIVFYDDFIVAPTQTLIKPLGRMARVATAGTPPAVNPVFTMGVAKNEVPKLK